MSNLIGWGGKNGREQKVRPTDRQTKPFLDQTLGLAKTRATSIAAADISGCQWSVSSGTSNRTGLQKGLSMYTRDESIADSFTWVCLFTSWSAGCPTLECCPIRGWIHACIYMRDRWLVTQLFEEHVIGQSLAEPDDRTPYLSHVPRDHTCFHREDVLPLKASSGGENPPDALENNKLFIDKLHEHKQ